MVTLHPIRLTASNSVTKQSPVPLSQSTEQNAPKQAKILCMHIVHIHTVRTQEVHIKCTLISSNPPFKKEGNVQAPRQL